MTIEQDELNIIGARVHNLKNIDISIPHNQLTVITGLSGSGKSSLAFDTIFAEGQRRYLETLSAYARNMIGNMERPDVDKITGLSPVISIEQKTVNKNPRSTIGTTTEIYDFLRLMYARAAQAYSHLSGKLMVKYTTEEILELIINRYDEHKIYILAPLVRNRKGHYKELFEQLAKKGYINVRIDGTITEITHGLKLDRYKNHNIELLVDKLKISAKESERLEKSVKQAFKRGEGQLMIYDLSDDSITHYSRTLMDPETGLSYREPAPHNFSFNSPQGQCPRCKGIGYINIIDQDKLIPDRSISIHAGAIVAVGKYKSSLLFWQITAICEKYGVTLKTPIKDIPEDCLDEIFNGVDGTLHIRNESIGRSDYATTYEGLIHYIELQQTEDSPSAAQRWAEQFYSRCKCPECNGTRLNLEARQYFINDKSIDQLASMDIKTLSEWFIELPQHLNKRQTQIATEIIKEVNTRLHFLLDVGLGYLSLNRATATLSGGESQRIRLATQIGSQLVNVLYILDEPSIGLHQRDNLRLINSLKKLRDADNTVIVVEHDKDIMLQSDYVIDLGPYAGRKGGEIIFAGTPTEML
ncbi:MAG: excinuclease ABC subunit UvrA, partial [Bacteroidales bacterium]